MQNSIIILSLLLKVTVSIEPIPDADDELHIYALPVGQGDCTVIQCPRGQGDPPKGTVTIIDAGSSTEKLGMKGKDIEDFLKGTELRLAVLTHSDADHLKYMNGILNFYNNKKVPIYHSCEWNKHYTKHISKEYTNHKEIPRCMSIKQCSKKLDLCPRYKPKFGVTLFFVASAVGKCTGHRANNADSLIAKITYAGRSILIAGDFELPQKEMKNFLKLKGVKDSLRSHIYRLSHHGAYNSKANRYDFLNAVGASYVFSSSGFSYREINTSTNMDETNSVEQGSENDSLMITVHGNENINDNVSFEDNVKIKDGIDREQKRFKHLPEEFSKRSPEEFSKRLPEEIPKCLSDPVLPSGSKRNIESLPFNPLSNENLSLEMEAKIESLSKRGRPVNILVIGPARSGKSELVNAMFGEDVAKVGLKSLSLASEEYKGEYKGVMIKIYDTVGFRDTGGRSYHDTLVNITEHGQYDLILICTKLVDRANHHMFLELASVLHEEMWKRTVVVLTFANHFIKLESVRGSNDIEEIIKTEVKKHQARVVEFLSKSVDKEVLNNIPFCIAGVKDKRKLPTVDDWLSSLWATSIQRSSDETRPFLSFYARNRRGIIEAGSFLGAVGAGAGIGAVVGAGIGSVVPVAGTVIGGAVGAGVGSAVGGVVSLLGIIVGRIHK
uniref:G domain-containing protein n=1 Tax=Amphimedon queenslandica TaxID=400682 RepID=A0A1X7T4F1_AMPQE